MEAAEPRTVATPARVWLENSKAQLRFEIEETNGCRFLRVSLWVQAWNGWHPLAGGVLSGWRRPIAVISALIKSWIALRVRSFSGRLNRPDRGGER
jgi:hypothetical protein